MERVSVNEGGTGGTGGAKRRSRGRRKGYTAVTVTVKGSEVLTKLSKLLGTYKSAVLEELSFLTEKDNASVLLAYKVIKNLLSDRDVSLKLTVLVDGKSLSRELLALLNGGEDKGSDESRGLEADERKVVEATPLSSELTGEESSGGGSRENGGKESEAVAEESEKLKEVEETVRQIESELQKGRFFGFTHKLID